MAAEHTSCTIPDLKAGIFTLKKILNKYNISEVWSFVPFLTGDHGCDHFLFCLTLKDVFDTDSRVVFGLYTTRPIGICTISRDF